MKKRQGRSLWAKRCLQLAGIKQSDFAEQCGIVRKRLQGILNDKIHGTDQEIDKICEKLDGKEDNLFAGEHADVKISL